MQSFDLTQLGISGPQVLRDLLPAILYEEAIRFDHKTSNSTSGALVAPIPALIHLDGQNRFARHF